MPTYKAYNIDYDTDGEVVDGLPETVLFEAEDDTDASLTGADQISDKTGWCVNSFSYEEVSDNSSV